MDLFFGWYIDALPADRVFDTCVSAFGLFREKFKQEIDWALKMSRQFTEDMEGAVKSVKTDDFVTDLSLANCLVVVKECGCG